ncbi:SCO6881 family protein [Kitasatospora brasiliensis]|uniref:SCO6881 family protein n=1 Tax=Kitasatospora brasiliensis TaxID=3058040 RepID=UPI00292EFAC9|nr:ATP-binding protein [Kitasatospora sp. K002]
MDICNLPMVSQVCDVVDGINFVSDPGKSITDGIGAWIAKSMGELAASAVDLCAKAVDETTAIDLSAPWFRDNYQLILPIGLILTVGTFCAQLVLAAWRRDERALAKAGWGTMTGVLFAFGAISFTAIAVTVVDALSAGLFQAAHTSVADAVRRMIKVSQFGAMFPLGWAIPSLVAVGSAIGAFLYWGVMVARKVGVLILVALAAFAGAGGGWEVAQRWRRGWIEATATLIVSKLLMTVVFLVGVSALGKTDAKDGMAALSDAMAGVVIMVMVLLCPYAVYKFVHWATDGSGHDDTHRTGMAGMAVAAGAAKTAGSLAMQMSIGVPAPQGAAQVPGMGGGGAASGIDPTGRISKEGIDAGPAQQPTKFRFGEDTNAGGDRGRALVTRPGIPALITRAAPGGGGDESATSGGQEGVAAQPAAPSVPGVSTAPAAPAPSAPGPAPAGPGAPAPASAGPAPDGVPAPEPARFVYPGPTQPGS